MDNKYNVYVPHTCANCKFFRNLSTWHNRRKVGTCYVLCGEVPKKLGMRNPYRVGKIVFTIDEFVADRTAMLTRQLQWIWSSDAARKALDNHEAMLEAAKIHVAYYTWEAHPLRRPVHKALVCDAWEPGSTNRTTAMKSYVADANRILLQLGGNTDAQ